jgi:hypothetical protein
MGEFNHSPALEDIRLCQHSTSMWRVMLLCLFVLCVEGFFSSWDSVVSFRHDVVAADREKAWWGALTAASAAASAWDADGYSTTKKKVSCEERVRGGEKEGEKKC